MIASIKGDNIDAGHLLASFDSLVLESVHSIVQNQAWGASLGISGSAGDKSSPMGKLSHIGASHRSEDGAIVDQITRLIGRETATVVVARALHLNAAMIANAEVGDDGLYTDKGRLALKVGELFIQNMQSYDRGEVYGVALDLLHSGLSDEEPNDKDQQTSNKEQPATAATDNSKKKAKWNFQAEVGHKSRKGTVLATIGLGDVECLGEHCDTANRDLNAANTLTNFKRMESIKVFIPSDLPSFSEISQDFRDASAHLMQGFEAIGKTMGEWFESKLGEKLEETVLDQTHTTTKAKQQTTDPSDSQTDSAEHTCANGAKESFCEWSSSDYERELSDNQAQDASNQETSEPQVQTWQDAAESFLQEYESKFIELLAKSEGKPLRKAFQNIDTVYSGEKLLLKTLITLGEKKFAQYFSAAHKQISTAMNWVGSKVSDVYRDTTQAIDAELYEAFNDDYLQFKRQASEIKTATGKVLGAIDTHVPELISDFVAAALTDAAVTGAFKAAQAAAKAGKSAVNLGRAAGTADDLARAGAHADDALHANSHAGNAARITASATELKPLGLGSTGRTVANNLNEQLVMQEIMSNPAMGRNLGVQLSDPRWQGWKKMHWYDKDVNVEIHYVGKFENGALKAVDDFKFIERTK